MWLLVVIISGSYLNDIHFQEFTTQQHCEVVAAKIHKNIPDSVVSCELK